MVLQIGLIKDHMVIIKDPTTLEVGVMVIKGQIANMIIIQGLKVIIRVHLIALEGSITVHLLLGVDLVIPLEGQTIHPIGDTTLPIGQTIHQTSQTTHQIDLNTRQKGISILIEITQTKSG